MIKAQPSPLSGPSWLRSRAAAPGPEQGPALPPLSQVTQRPRERPAWGDHVSPTLSLPAGWAHPPSPQGAWHLQKDSHHPAAKYYFSSPPCDLITHVFYLHLKTFFLI